MTVAKASALACGFVGATAFGVWLGPYVTYDRATIAVEHGATVVEAPVPKVALPPAPAPAPTPAKTPASRRLTLAPAIHASEPALHDRLKPLLNRGVNMKLASEGFHDGEQFAALAHAARNTNVPFVLLKHRVLNQGKTLGAAIHESKPGVDASVEASRAIAEAKSDVARLKS